MEPIHNKRRSLRQIIREVSSDKEVPLDVIYDLSYLTVEMRDKRDEIFYSLMKDMFNNGISVDIKALDQRFRHFEYEHVARVIAIVFSPTNRGKLVQGMLDLCKRYEREMEMMKNAKTSFIRPYLISESDKPSAARRQYSTIQELLDSLQERHLHPLHDDVLRAVNEKCYDGDIKDGVVILACLANRYKTELYNLFNICTEYLNEHPEDLSSDELERMDAYRHSIKVHRATDEISADKIWEDGVTDYSTKILESLANVCNRYKEGIEDLSQVYSSKRQIRDEKRINAMLSETAK